MQGILCSWITIVNIATMAVCPKLVYGVNTVPIGVLVGFFTEVDKLILKCM